MFVLLHFSSALGFYEFIQLLVEISTIGMVATELHCVNVKDESERGAERRMKTGKFLMD